MSVADLLKGVSTTDLTVYARNVPTPADFLLTNTVFAERQVKDVKWRIRQSKRRVNAASYRAYDASVPFAQRQAETTQVEGMLPALGQKLVVTELEQLLLDASRGADDDRLVELLYDDVERHVEAIRSRLELAAADVLLDGKFSLTGENGLTVEVDYKVPAANMPTAAKPWSDPSSDPIADELRWMSYLDDIGAPAPEMVLTSQKAWSHLASNMAYRAAYYGTPAGGQTPTATLNPEQVNSVRGTYGLPPVTFYRAQVWQNNVSKRVLPEDRWIMLPPDRTKWGETQYGTTAESLALSRGTTPAIEREDAPGIIVTRDVEDDPVQIWTKGAACAMPVLYSPDCHIAAKVL
ncbi:major capsid protein [Streptomyces olivoreticuli]|uniref:major capsid protein n=1 Tax=Streptomyces olivoreticuli TaxID=68246 RepID=UPI000E22CAF8|nr:major capsid protein [Streptomyces olivoreticuli]